MSVHTWQIIQKFNHIESEFIQSTRTEKITTVKIMKVNEWAGESVCTNRKLNILYKVRYRKMQINIFQPTPPSTTGLSLSYIYIYFFCLHPERATISGDPI